MTQLQFGSMPIPQPDVDPARTPAQKWCRGCERDLPAQDFFGRSASPDGLDAQCRGCRMKQKRKYRAALMARSDSEIAEAFEAAPPSKRCCICKHDIPKSLLTRDRGRRDTLASVCKACAIAKSAALRDELDPDEVKSRRRASYRRNRDTHLAAWLRNKYGLTTAQHEAMFAAQSGLCAICGEPESAQRQRESRRLCVDHDHKTGAIRGLLCSACNRGIGLLQDSPDVLMAAAAYLIQHKEALQPQGV